MSVKVTEEGALQSMGKSVTKSAVGFGFTKMYAGLLTFEMQPLASCTEYEMGKVPALLNTWVGLEDAVITVPSFMSQVYLVMVVSPLVDWSEKLTDSL